METKSSTSAANKNSLIAKTKALWSAEPLALARQCPEDKEGEELRAKAKASLMRMMS